MSHYKTVYSREPSATQDTDNRIGGTIVADLIARCISEPKDKFGKHDINSGMSPWRRPVPGTRIQQNLGETASQNPASPSNVTAGVKLPYRATYKIDIAFLGGLFCRSYIIAFDVA